VQDKNYCFH